MKRPTFNLVDEPWVPVEFISGSAAEVSLHETFSRAREIRRVSDQSPLVTAAVYRLLFAITHRALQVSNDDGWLDAWDAYEVARPALAYLEEWRHRFDLFDEYAPFMQVRDLSDSCQFPWTKLALERAPNSSKLLFDHTNTLAPPTADPATVVRYLLACLTFTVGAGKSCTGYTTGAPLAGALTVIPEGRDLAETLLANLVPSRNEADLAAWEDEPLTVARLLEVQEARSWAGPASRLTWLSRAVRLVPEDEAGNVRWVNFGMGLRPVVADGDRDPWVSYRPTKEGARVPLKLNLDRLVWRDLHALLHDKQDAHTEAVLVVTRLPHLMDGQRQPPKEWSLMVAGHVADKASVLAWRLERWEVPRSVIDDPDRKSALTDAMRLAEGTAISLSKVVWRLAAELIGQNRSREDVSAVASGLPAERTYWTTLSGAFQGYLHELGQDRDRAEMTWRNAVAEAVSAASDAAYRTIGNDVKAIRAWAKVGPAFNGLRARALGPKDAVGGEAA